MNKDDRNKELALEDLENVSGGQWTEADDYMQEVAFRVIADLPEMECGVCGVKGGVQKVDAHLRVQGTDMWQIRYRCKNCRGSVGIAQSKPW